MLQFAVRKFPLGWGELAWARDEGLSVSDELRASHRSSVEFARDCCAREHSVAKPSNLLDVKDEDVNGDSILKVLVDAWVEGDRHPMTSAAVPSSRRCQNLW